MRDHYQALWPRPAFLYNIRTRTARPAQALAGSAPAPTTHQPTITHGQERSTASASARYTTRRQAPEPLLLPVWFWRMEPPRLLLPDHAAEISDTAWPWGLAPSCLFRCGVQCSCRLS
ncbi:hypothetical protein BJY00DRAFT_284611 [Aspergillus carlsbadensis]|nr:hypothetical protein BJY00DRAFT_284611 [Aspergillus carlsbadensis]